MFLDMSGERFRILKQVAYNLEKHMNRGQMPKEVQKYRLESHPLYQHERRTVKDNRPEPEEEYEAQGA